MSIVTSKLGEGNTKLTPEQLKKFSSMKDEDIDTSDIPEITQEWLSKVKVIRKEVKTSKTIRFNTKAINFIKQKQGKGYQTLINNMVVEWAKHNGMK